LTKLKRGHDACRALSEEMNSVHSASEDHTVI